MKVKYEDLDNIIENIQNEYNDMETELDEATENERYIPDTLIGDYHKSMDIMWEDLKKLYEFKENGRPGETIEI